MKFMRMFLNLDMMNSKKYFLHFKNQKIYNHYFNKILNLNSNMDF